MIFRGLPVPLLTAMALSLATTAAPALAQQARAETCAAIADDTERLGCYDALFRNVGNIPAADITIDSERLIPALPTGRGPATMMVSCLPTGPAVSFAFAGQLVSSTSDIAPVTFQVDSGGTAVRTLAANEANTVLSFDAGRASIAFLDSLAGGTNLKVRMTPVRQRSLTVDFRLQEHAEAIGALRERCVPN
ncbi:MAG TPA: hypothetical protein PK286_10970 [Devosia sp.]|nr:hypothetical protein [Devosia sp.]